MKKTYTNDMLKSMQELPLERKILITQTRLMEWYTAWENKCYISFSGGKDSTVLADITAQICKLLECKLVLWYSDTGLEYPELKDFVKSMREYLSDKYNMDVELVMDYPKTRKGDRITFRDVITNYGYPVISKEVSRDVGRVQKKGEINHKTGDYTYAYKLLHDMIYSPSGKLSIHNKSKYLYLVDSGFKISDECCNIMKKNPAHRFNHSSGMKPIIATLTEESIQRKSQWLQAGCNAFDAKYPSSKPLSFWTEQDILQYIKTYDIPIASVYGDVICEDNIYKTTGCSRTGCLFCMFGVQFDKTPNRFQQLKMTHPDIYNYCMRPCLEKGLGLAEILDYLGIDY